MQRHHLILALLALLLPASAGAQERLAIKGYDPVAYFTEGKPVPGKPELSSTWQDARWQFASPAHRDLFVASPEKYAPQYGGYCALGVSMGGKYEVDPEQWTIVDGKLYLNYDRKGRDTFRADQVATIGKANQNWGKLKP